MAMYDALRAYQEDKRFEEYLIIKQKMGNLAEDVQIRLATVLEHFFLKEKDLLKVSSLVQKANMN